MNAVIRPGTLADADEVARLQGQLFAESWSVVDIRAQISLPKAVLVVADGADGVGVDPPDGDRRLVGYALGQVAVDEVELRSIGVERHLQNQGFGRDLLRAWEDLAQALGAIRSVLEVAEDNASARAVYEAQGYRAVGKRPGYYRTAQSVAVDALVLERRLGASKEDLSA